MGVRDHLADQLDAVRRRSLDLVAPLPDGALRHQHSPLMSPLVWDLAHVANYEELWLVRALGGPALHPEYDDRYDAFRHPRRDRPRLELLGPSEARAYLHEVRGRALDLLDRAELGGGDPLVHEGFVYAMVVQHEHQHDETMLATLQLMDGAGYGPAAPAPGGGAAPAMGELPTEVLHPGGTFLMGTGTEAAAYDNERPAHAVTLAPFLLDTTPVTNGAYAAFVEDGGYRDRRWWTDEGWTWLRETGAAGPAFWERDGSGWERVRFGWRERVPPEEPVQHVCWHEADAYARWAGRRLPTEAEWEYAASWGPDGRKRRWPWGDDAPTPARANLGGGRYRPAPAGAHPAGASAWGVHQLVGDVWEWTSSPFAGYPGFRSFPYREYSEVFYGDDYRVLRGGSWATDAVAVRATFRNWDYPVRRQIFAGFRTARDAD